MKRTHSCGEINESLSGKTVTLAGWVHRRRDLGGLIFIDLRDREGLVQAVFDSVRDSQVHQEAQNLNREDVVAVQGEVVKRRPGTENAKLSSGWVELAAKKLSVLNPCSAHFPIARLDEEGESSLPNEEVRFKYRYLDLRRRRMFENLKLRHQIIKSIRDFLDAEGFLEVETPMLIRTTPEGARDYLVPSRLYSGKFYALPQSPQLFKQLLMVAGFEKYFQIARCFRDEDSRADRQPEFTQLDLEMSFITREEIFSLLERLFQSVFHAILGIEIPIPFPRLSYRDSMSSYGTDKPDLRFDFPIQDFREIFRNSSFSVFRETLEQGGAVLGIHVPQGKKQFSRKQLENFSEWMKKEGGKGLFFLSWSEGEEQVQSSLAKHLNPTEIRALGKQVNGSPGDLTFLAADRTEFLEELLGKLRVQIAGNMKITPKNRFEFAWIVDFPLVQWNGEEKRFEPLHHPFTSPHPEDLHSLETDPKNVRANAYDLVLNGYEIGGGSIRIHERPLQEKIFRLIGLSPEEALEKFGFLLEAFQYGAPPHGGIAVGLDRLTMLLAGEESIREVIAFPKTQNAQDLMLGAPAEATPKQLEELHLKIRR